MASQNSTPGQYTHVHTVQQFELRIIQQPRIARTLPKTVRAKGQTWPVDPPPVIELVSNETNPEKWFHIHNPNWFCLAEAEQVSGSNSPPSRRAEEESKSPAGGHTGSWSSSLHKVKGGPEPTDKQVDHGYFVFGDICIRKSGMHRLKFTLFDVRSQDDYSYAVAIHSIYSNDFKVQTSKPENVASTPFSRYLSEAGVKVRLRAETTKRKQPRTDWSSTQSESMTRQLHMAPMQSGFMAPPANPGRGRNNASIDISDRIQTSHTPLSNMTAAPATFNPYVPQQPLEGPSGGNYQPMFAQQYPNWYQSDAAYYYPQYTMPPSSAGLPQYAYTIQPPGFQAHAPGQLMDERRFLGGAGSLPSPTKFVGQGRVQSERMGHPSWAIVDEVDEHGQQ